MKYSKPSVTVANTEKLNPRGTCSNSFSCGGWLIHLVVIANIHAVEEIFHVRIIIK